MDQFSNYTYLRLLLCDVDMKQWFKQFLLVHHVGLHCTAYRRMRGYVLHRVFLSVRLSVSL